jgi:hypothetical protein
MLAVLLLGTTADGKKTFPAEGLPDPFYRAAYRVIEVGRDRTLSGPSTQ